MLKSLKNKGAALVSALMVLVILGMICGGFVTIVVNNKRWADNEATNYHLLYTAMAGLEYGKWLIKHNLGYYPATYYNIDLYDKSGTLRTFIGCYPGSIYNIYGTRHMLSSFTNGGGTLGNYSSLVDTINSGYAYHERRHAEHVFISNTSFSSDGSNAGESGVYTSGNFYTSGNYRSGNYNPLRSKMQVSTFSLALRQWDHHDFNSDYTATYKGNINSVYGIYNGNSWDRMYCELVSTARVWRLGMKGATAGESTINTEKFTGRVMNSGSGPDRDDFYSMGARVIGTKSVKCEFICGNLKDGTSTLEQDPTYGSTSRVFNHHREIWR